MHSNNDISKSSLSFFKWNFNKQKVWLREADAQLALAGPAIVTNVTFRCLFNLHTGTCLGRTVTL